MWNPAGILNEFINDFGVFGGLQISKQFNFKNILVQSADINYANLTIDFLFLNLLSKGNLKDTRFFWLNIDKLIIYKEIEEGNKTWSFFYNSFTLFEWICQHLNGYNNLKRFKKHFLVLFLLYEESS